MILRIVICIIEISSLHIEINSLFVFPGAATPASSRQELTNVGASCPSTWKNMVFDSRDNWVYPDPSVPRHGKSLYMPYIVGMYGL